MKTLISSAAVAAVLAVVTFAGTALAAEEEFAPYGTAKVDMHKYPEINQVFDLNYIDPKKINILNAFIINTRKVVPGKTVIVTHGPELRLFAKENYEKYRGIVDKMASLAEEGVEFRMCNNAMTAAGFKASDMHGFITVIPAGFPEIVYLQNQGYRYINPLPYGVRGARYIDQPGKKPKKG